MLSTTCLEWLSGLGQWVFEEPTAKDNLVQCIEIDVMDNQLKVLRAMIAIEASISRPVVAVWDDIPKVLRGRAQAISNTFLMRFEKKIRKDGTLDLPALRQELDEFAFHRVLDAVTRPRRQVSPS